MKCRRLKSRKQKAKCPNCIIPKNWYQLGTSYRCVDCGSREVTVEVIEEFEEYEITKRLTGPIVVKGKRLTIDQEQAAYLYREYENKPETKEKIRSGELEYVHIDDVYVENPEDITW